MNLGCDNSDGSGYRLSYDRRNSLVLLYLNRLTIVYLLHWFLIFKLFRSRKELRFEL